MKRVGTMMLILVTTVRYVHAATDPGKDPTTIAGVPWLATRAEVISRLGLAERSCYDMSLVGVPTEVWCDHKLNFDEREPLSMQFMLIRDQLVRVRITYFASDFDFVRDVLTTKYGTPSSSRDEETYTRGGAKVMNTRLIWKFTTATIEMSRYADTTTAGAALITLNSYLEELRAKEAAAKKKAIDAF
jgi:hypothetical protein